MQYKPPKKAAAEIAKELHADVVVEGSVQRSGDRGESPAQLIRAAPTAPLGGNLRARLP